MSGAAIRVVVGSRRRLVRDAICACLAGRPEFTVVGHTGAIESLAELCALRRPDAVLVDSTELTTQKVDSLARIRTAAPAVQVVVTYAEVSPPALDAAVRAGITALVPGSRGLEAVLRIVRERSYGNGYRLPDGLALTEYDMRIVALLNSGHSVPEMAELLQISPRTVENHKRRLYVKLGVGSSSQAVSKALLLGLTDPPRVSGRVRTEEPGRSPLVVVIGSAGPGVDRVHQLLVAAGTPVVFGGIRAELRQEHWARWQRGAVLAVLVDPADGDWRVAASLGARTVVVLSKDPDLPAMVDILLRGASAIVRGADIDVDLAPVLSVVVRGYVAMDAARIDDLTGGAMVRMTSRAAQVPALTAREYDVLHEIASGHTIRQAAQLLGITAKTVENAQTRLYRKLGVHNREEALAVAHRWGLLDADAP
jgi:DNA-binding NarL/FixJ family response regulator